MSLSLSSLFAPIRKLRSSRIQVAVRSLAGRVIDVADTDAVRAEQLLRLNRIWKDVRETVPKYQRLVAQDAVPQSFHSLDEFHQTVPCTTRDELRSSLDQFVSSSQSSDQFRSTGGSTAEPIRFPVSNSEIQSVGPATWLARSWIGIAPEDRLFLLWGHSHLFGSGWQGWLNRQKRAYSDFALGYCRFSAYDMSEMALGNAAKRLIAFRPTWCLGYSVAWDRFADANWEMRESLRKLQIKAVVATAEAFPRSDSRNRIEELFGCPVLMEYGSVETGMLAQEVGAENYQVVWQNHLLESIENGGSVGQTELAVTSLFPRRVPLIRYRIGDQIQGASPGPSILHFSAVGGRCNDYLELPSGKRIHSEAFAHILRDLPGVRTFQAVQRLSEPITLNLVLTNELSSNLKEKIQERLSRLDATLKNTTIERVTQLEHSVAGKTPTVIRS